jgi:hypothetical protein
MTHLSGHDRSQLLLLPEAVDDYVGRTIRCASSMLLSMGWILRQRDILDQRRETVEHPFGTIEQWMNQGAFLMRESEKVRAEFSLTALAYNLRRVLNIVGLPKLIAALPA